MATDYYKLLGVDRSADVDSIQRAYRRNALKLHPDKNKSAGAKESFLRTAEAYDVLSDVRRKAIYDQYGANGLQHGVPPRDDGFEGFPGGYQFHGNALQVFDAFFGGKNPFQDFFAGHAEPQAIDPAHMTARNAGGTSAAFGPKFGGLHGMGQSSRLIKPAQLEPMLHQLEVTLEELYNGTVKKVEITRRILNDDGATTTEGSKVFLVDIHKGWRHGTKITFQKEGDQGANKIPADVVFVLHEKPHPTFKRKGNDLHYTAQMPLIQALSGSVLQLDTLDGRKLQIPINEVVSPTYEKIVQNEGMPLSKDPRHQQRGNLILRFQLTFPKYFNRQQKELLRLAFDENGVAAQGKVSTKNLLQAISAAAASSAPAANRSGAEAGNDGEDDGGED